MAAFSGLQLCLSSPELGIVSVLFLILATLMSMQCYLIGVYHAFP